MLSKNPNITWEIVKDNPDEDWNWRGLSGNQNITLEIVKDNINKDWSWNRLSYNPNITWEIVKDNPDEDWYWGWLSSNPFTKNKEIFIEQKLKEHMMAFRIQTYWRRANYDPKYKLCKNRLMKQYEMLFE